MAFDSNFTSECDEILEDPTLCEDTCMTHSTCESCTNPSVQCGWCSDGSGCLRGLPHAYGPMFRTCHDWRWPHPITDPYIPQGYQTLIANGELTELRTDRYTVTQIMLDDFFPTWGEEISPTLQTPLTVNTAVLDGWLLVKLTNGFPEHGQEVMLINWKQQEGKFLKSVVSYDREEHCEEVDVELEYTERGLKGIFLVNDAPCRINRDNRCQSVAPCSRASRCLECVTTYFRFDEPCVWCGHEEGCIDSVHCANYSLSVFERGDCKQNEQPYKPNKANQANGVNQVNHPHAVETGVGLDMGADTVPPLSSAESGGATSALYFFLLAGIALCVVTKRYETVY